MKGIKVVYSDKVEAFIQYGPNQPVPFWEIVRFAQELAPNVTIDTKGDFAVFEFPDGSSTMVEYRKGE